MVKRTEQDRVQKTSYAHRKVDIRHRSHYKAIRNGWIINECARTQEKNKIRPLVPTIMKIKLK